METVFILNCDLYERIITMGPDMLTSGDFSHHFLLDRMCYEKTYLTYHMILI
jgi:hypothetical protein